ncbi:hypothetical protein Acid7E03_28960 [Acidisoma sp. 7E03]
MRETIYPIPIFDAAPPLRKRNHAASGGGTPSAPVSDTVAFATVSGVKVNLLGRHAMDRLPRLRPELQESQAQN